MADEDGATIARRLQEEEQRWRDRPGMQASKFYTHECARGLLDALRLDKSPEGIASGLDTLFKHIGDRLDLGVDEVRDYLSDAVREGELRQRPAIALDRASTLRCALDNQAERYGHPKLATVIVAPVHLPVHLMEPSKPGDPDEQPEDPRMGVARATAVARVAADYFTSVVPAVASAVPAGGPTCVVGVSGGRTMLEVCKEFTDSGEHRYTNLAICPLAGEAEPELFGISANSVALRFGEACGPDTTFRALMTTPFTGLQADAKTWKDGQRRSRALNEIAKLAERATFAFTGIGGTDENCALWRLARHCDMPILSGVKSKVAGDICYRPITADGNDGWTDLSDRLFGLELDGLRALARSQARRVFAIASGRQKAIGIIAAVRGGYVNSLITDEITAADILANLPEPDGPGQVPASRECTHECGSQPPCTNPEEG